MKIINKHWLPALLSIFVIAVMAFASYPFNVSASQDQDNALRPLPEFTQTNPDAWINSPPLTLANLKGKVLLVDVWTFGCWNCYRSFPWLQELEGKLANENFQVIGIHSPEFEHEHDRNKVVAKTKEFGLHHPVMMDNDFRYWTALKNRFWPAFYLVDKGGNIRGRYVGETHSGSQTARTIEANIRHLLAEQHSMR